MNTVRLHRPGGPSGTAGIGMLMLLFCLTAAAEPDPISPPVGRKPAVWLGPQELDPAAAGVGRRLPDIALRDLQNRGHRLHQVANRLGTVIVVRDPECPVSRRYGPRIAKLARRFTVEGFGFVFIYPTEALDRAALARDARVLGVPGIYVVQGGFALADALGVKSTGDVFVLDAEYRLRYRGAVDDQYGLGYTREFPSRHLLRNALEAVQHGQEPATPATTAPGCFIDSDPGTERLLPGLPGGQMMS